MFYILSKALLFLIQPMFWLVLLLIWALRTRSRRRKRNLIFICSAALLILGNSFILTSAMQAWEWPKTAPPEDGESAVVLGGYGMSQGPGDFELNKAADRLTSGVALLEQGKIEWLILSSGVRFEEEGTLTESEASKIFLDGLGVETQKILCETSSWNTHQNALYTAELLEEQGLTEPVILITSAFHMRRAKACFEKAGIEVRPYATDYTWDTTYLYGTDYFIPYFQNVLSWQVLFKEMVGMTVYRLKGYI